jgi:spermidine/putrescine-binding protein
MGSSDDLVAKLHGGSASNYDVISPSSDVATSIARTGLAEPLDLSKIPVYSQLSTRLRDLPLVKVNSQTFGVPFMWGPNPLLYDTTAFAQPPDSWEVIRELVLVELFGKLFDALFERPDNLSLPHFGVAAVIA